ncbi:MAG: hypothetical protein EBY09_18990, partial [Verrucomicrobia bacterium]|nr:hypothetical protein [Verrucomicrobiota bacterium]
TAVTFCMSVRPDLMRPFRKEVRPVRQPARTSVRSRRERLARIDAIAAAMPPLPADFAAEHDHYIHGIPKRSSRG